MTLQKLLIYLLQSQKGKDLQSVMLVAESFVDNAILLCEKDISKCYIDYHRNMNREVFKNWLGDKFIPNILKERKTLIVLDNAKNHCRLMEKHLQ